jgi:hypothetical protein
MTEPVEVPADWRRWAALSLLRGAPLAVTIEALVGEGVPEGEAAAACAEILTSPAYEAGKWVVGQVEKLGSVLDATQQMAGLASGASEIARRKGLTRAEFLDRYYSTNTPVVLEDVSHEWPARKLWSPEYLLDTLGSAEVEVMTGRLSGYASEINQAQHRTMMPFDEYVAKVQATEWSNDFYLVANNHLLSSKTGAALWKDFRLDKRYMKADRTKKSTFLWFGPGGTVTSLHHDVMNILFHQISGWKHAILISPLYTHRLSNTVGVYSDIDPLAPDLERFPEFGGVRQLQVTVGPGDALFVPVGWWHHVTALETSISLSSTSFVFPNSLHWDHPTAVI